MWYHVQILSFIRQTLSQESSRTQSKLMFTFFSTFIKELCIQGQRFKLHTVFSNRIKISSPKSLSFQSKILRNAAFYKTSVVRSQYVKHSCYDIKNYSYNIN